MQDLPKFIFHCAASDLHLASVAAQTAIAEFYGQDDGMSLHTIGLREFRVLVLEHNVVVRDITDEF